jgi:hypothetical protein
MSKDISFYGSELQVCIDNTRDNCSGTRKEKLLRFLRLSEGAYNEKQSAFWKDAVDYIKHKLKGLKEKGDENRN